MTLGSKIKEIRKIRKMTLKLLGEQCNLSSSFLCDVEKDRANPSIEALLRIAKVLDTSVANLLGESESKDSLPQSFTNKVVSLLETTKGNTVFNYVSDFNNWSKSDQDELLKYLEIKQQLRNTETGA